MNEEIISFNGMSITLRDIFFYSPQTKYILSYLPYITTSRHDGEYDGYDKYELLIILIRIGNYKNILTLLEVDDEDSKIDIDKVYDTLNISSSKMIIFIFRAAYRYDQRLFDHLLIRLKRPFDRIDPYIQYLADQINCVYNRSNIVKILDKEFRTLFGMNFFSYIR